MKNKNNTDQKPVVTLFNQWLSGVGHRIADRLNTYTARWPPTLWKVVLVLFCIVVGTCCLMVAFSIWH